MQSLHLMTYAVNQPVTTLACGKTDAAAALLVAGTTTRVSVLRRAPAADWQLLPVLDVSLGVRCDAVALSPLASAPSLTNSGAPLAAPVAAAGADGRVRLCSGEETDTSASLQLLMPGHTDRITGLAYTADAGSLVSCSVDATARITDLATMQCSLVLRLPDAGAGVHTHAAHPHLLLTACRRAVRLVDMRTGVAVQSLPVPEAAVASVDWCPLDPRRVGAVCAQHWLVWDIAGAPSPDSGIAHSTAASCFAWSSRHRSVFATSSRDQVKVWDATMPAVPRVTSARTAVQHLAWHATQNVLVAAAGQQLSLSCVGSE